MKKVLVVIGTRPEAIKMAPVIQQLLQLNDCFETKVCLTAQHRQMLDQVLSFFQLPSHYDLNLMTQQQSLYELSSRILLGLQTILEAESPHVVLVHGDTTTSIMAALAAFYHRIPVGHVEAGLRTYNKYSPWPEEINRQLTARIADFHFAPTDLARQNLINENIKPEHIYVTGNTVIDALHFTIQKIKSSQTLEQELLLKLRQAGLNNVEQIFSKKIILVTGHRRENFGQGFQNICKALKTIAQLHPDTQIVYPVHLNPNVKKPVYEFLSDVNNISLIDPVDYQSFVYLMAKSTFVITDSGGIQEEAPGLGKPVLVMRDTTERPEAVEAGTVKLVGTDVQTIVDQANVLLTNESAYKQMANAVNPYGDGKAAQYIVDILKDKL
ncbi:MAG TPA: UDP-N-acetylglucosamine 2-epimerase (non-hydrolyzing) [Bacteroidales bacterium]|nr:UDP-N-acetylglucosamine 2-epimerase (non-hydrolyzing) [Bacteroidales bacterium]HOK98503.1 UDP-N-acetylglucosamine 2-epimerase (non-hydrolyzing) [Bacteroidales bacterium]HPO64429.1 UDP-N-acetylglucosamine 2-epimerase (non-hydrolyzing) [Bacteroidales bacterium]